MHVVADLLVAYRDTVSVHKRGHVQEKNRIRVMLLDPIAAIPLADLKRAHLREYRDRVLATGVTGSTFNRRLALIDHALKWALVEHDIGPGGLGKGLAQPENPARTRRLRPGEYERLLAAAGGHWIGAWIVLAVESAMRRGEIASLRWENINLAKRTAHLPLTKNGSARTVPLSTRAVAALESVRGHQPRIGLVFPFVPDAATRAFGRLCDQLAIHDLRLHDLRAECVSRLFEAGWSLPEVKAVSGRQSAIIMRYMRHNDPAALALKMG